MRNLSPTQTGAKNEDSNDCPKLLHAILRPVPAKKIICVCQETNLFISPIIKYTIFYKKSSVMKAFREKFPCIGYRRNSAFSEHTPTPGNNRRAQRKAEGGPLTVLVIAAFSGPTPRYPWRPAARPFPGLWQDL
jgi:hypothetical protein